MQRSARRTAAFCCAGESAHLSASLKCLYTDACSTGRGDRGSQKPVCNYSPATSLGSQRYGGIAHTTGVPQWMDTSSLASTGCEGREGVSHCTWESRAARAHGALPRDWSGASKSLWPTTSRQTNTSAPAARTARLALWYLQPLRLEGMSGARKTYTEKRTTTVGST